MPTYSYRCEKCGKKFERTETISEHETAKSKEGLCVAEPRLRGDIQKELNYRLDTAVSSTANDP
jgi:predicted nucleic acid-binding Zn ribbon protein